MRYGASRLNEFVCESVWNSIITQLCCATMAEEDACEEPLEEERQEELEAPVIEEHQEEPEQEQDEPNRIIRWELAHFVEACHAIPNGSRYTLSMSTDTIKIFPLESYLAALKWGLQQMRQRQDQQAVPNHLIEECNEQLRDVHAARKLLKRVMTRPNYWNGAICRDSSRCSTCQQAPLPIQQQSKKDLRDQT